MKIYNFIKTILFVTFGVLLFVFATNIMEAEGKRVSLLVGGVTLYYGIEGVVLTLVDTFKNKKQLRYPRLITFVIYIILAIILFANVYTSDQSLLISCIIWSVWAILREAEEINEQVVENWKNKVTSIVYLLLSLVTIVFSVMMICNPTKQHAHLHINLLGIELISTGLFIHINHLESLIISKIHRTELSQ